MLQTRFSVLILHLSQFLMFLGEKHFPLSCAYSSPCLHLEQKDIMVTYSRHKSFFHPNLYLPVVLCMLHLATNIICYLFFVCLFLINTVVMDVGSKCGPFKSLVRGKLHFMFMAAQVLCLRVCVNGWELFMLVASS